MGKFELPPWDKELRFCNVKRGDLVLMKSGHYAVVTKIRPSPFEDAAGRKLPPRWRCSTATIPRRAVVRFTEWRR